MLHYTLYRNKVVLDQLKSGLCVMGVADAMATHPELMETFFVAGKQAPLSGGNQTIIIQLPQYNYQYLHITV